MFQCAASGGRLERSHRRSASVRELLPKTSSRTRRLPSRNASLSSRARPTSSPCRSATPLARLTTYPRRFCRSALFGPRHEPVPVQVWKREQEPGQGLRGARVHLLCGERVEQDGRRIPPGPASTKMREPRIPEVGKFSRECVRIRRRAARDRGQGRGRQVQDAGEAPAQCVGRLPLAPFEQRHVPLRDAKACRQRGLGPAQCLPRRTEPFVVHHRFCFPVILQH